MSFLTLRISMSVPLMFSGMGIERLQHGSQSTVVAKTAQARDHGFGDVGDITVMSKRFAGIHIADVHFYTRDIDPGQRIAQCHAGMRQGCWINDYELGALGPCLMDHIDEFLLTIALKAGQRRACALRLGLEAMINFIEGLRAINFGLAGAEQIQIGAVKNQNRRHGPVRQNAKQGRECVPELIKSPLFW